MKKMITWRENFFHVVKRHLLPFYVRIATAFVVGAVIAVAVVLAFQSSDSEAWLHYLHVILFVAIGLVVSAIMGIVISWRNYGQSPSCVTIMETGIQWGNRCSCPFGKIRSIMIGHRLVVVDSIQGRIKIGLSDGVNRKELFAYLRKFVSDTSIQE